jgi:hypothetical protein
MALYGGSIPVEVRPGDKPTVVTVVCPNDFAHARLMQALNSIVPEAGQYTVPASVIAESHYITTEPYCGAPVVLADEIPADDDEGAPAEPPRTMPGEVGN